MHRAARCAQVIRVSVLALVAAGVAAAAEPAWAAADVGFRGPAFPPEVSSAHKPSGQKPQSKLWFNDGYWWGSLFASASGTFHVFRLDAATQTWVDTGTPLDDRPSSSADTLWDGTHLYVASSSDAANSPSSPDARRIQIFRLSYDATAKRYVTDSAYTPAIAAGPVETVVLDKDSTGRLWLTYTLDNSGGASRSVWVAHTDGPPADVWQPPFKLPGSHTTDLSPDDISAVVAYAGKIGVMWSNQTAQAFYLSTHVDGTADDAWSQTTATSDPFSADDHINLKSVQATGGRVFAVVKTSKGDQVPSPSAADQVDLLELNGDTWTRHPFGTVADDHTRPIVLTDQLTHKLYVFATSPTNPGTGQTIYYKEASLDNPSFAPGRGTVFIKSASGVDINDASSTKQDLATAPGAALVVLASDLTNYWHNVLDLGHPPPPSPPPPPPTPPPPPDRDAPRLTGLTVKPQAFWTRRRHGRPPGTTVRFTLSEGATVRLGAERAQQGRRVGGSCVRPTRSNRSRRACVRYLTVRAAITRASSAGPNRVAFSGRLGALRLAPASYRLVLTATDPAGNVSAPARAAFRVLR